MFNVDNLNRAFRECFVATATDARSLKWLAQLLGYTIGNKAPASVSVTVTCLPTHPEFTIPAGTRFTTVQSETETAVVFEAAASVIVLEDQVSAEVDCTQGFTIAEEVLGSSNGSPDQIFKCRVNGGIDGSESVWVRTGLVWELWTHVSDWLASGPTSQHYQVENDTADDMYIVFGDGIVGAIPTSGVSNIKITYRIGGGADGNVAAETIVQLGSSIDYVLSVTNPDAASGGSDREDLGHIRKFLPYSHRFHNRAVSVIDMKYAAETFVSPTYGRVVKAAVVEQNRINIDLRIVPAHGGLPSAGLKTELLAYLNQIRAACIEIVVGDPGYVPIDIDLDIYIRDNYHVGDTVDAVRRAIVQHLSPVYADPDTGIYSQEFGDDVHPGDLYHVVESVPGVKWSDLTTPATTVTIAATDIATPGTINITAHLGAASWPFLNLSTEL
jgi:predicted phage baseplate assembly protein